jgi:predicted TIM-barrel fold metal-dependent hydrolase
MGRVVEQTEVKGRGREQITRSPRDDYQQVYLDLVSPDPLALDFALHTAGPERLLFGSDHPWVGIETMLDYVRSCNWPHETVEKALYQNAARLFRIAG